MQGLIDCVMDVARDFRSWPLAQHGHAKGHVRLVAEESALSWKSLYTCHMYVRMHMKTHAHAQTHTHAHTDTPMPTYEHACIQTTKHMCAMCLSVSLYKEMMLCSAVLQLVLQPPQSQGMHRRATLSRGPNPILVRWEGRNKSQAGCIHLSQ